MSDWLEEAACRWAPPEMADLAFGSADEQRVFIATYCGRCRVKPQCFVAGRDEHGVFGGTTQAARSRKAAA